MYIRAKGIRKVVSFPETIKKISTFRAKENYNSARNVDFSFIVSGNESTYTFRIILKCTILVHLDKLPGLNMQKILVLYRKQITASLT